MTISSETSDAPVDAGDGGQGLAKGSISLAGILFVSIATMAPGAGLAYAIMTGSLFSGGALPLSVVGATIGCVLVAVGIAQMAKHISTAGGLGSFVGRAFHPALGFVVAFCAPMFYLAAIPYLGWCSGIWLPLRYSLTAERDTRPPGSSRRSDVCWSRVPSTTLAPHSAPRRA